MISGLLPTADMRRHLGWWTLRLGTEQGRALATDRMADGYLSDMVNLTRAKDAALSLALAALNSRYREAA